MMHYPLTQRRYKYKLPLLIGFIFSSAAVVTIDAFSSPSLNIGRVSMRRGNRLQLQAHQLSDELISLLSAEKDDQDDDKVKSAVTSLESTFHSSSDITTDEENDDPSRFDPLIGLYEVKSVLSKNKKDNPVGGKWTRSNGLAQKLFQTRATFQHLLPFNATGQVRSEEAVAEAINIVGLDALGGLLRATVILRGDAVPLSSEELCEMNTNRTITPLTNLAVRAYFDPPRIFFGKRTKGNKYSYLPLQIGPNSSVVLDTTYYDKLVRIGMGGTSGTRFVFTSTAVEEAKEYEALLKIPYAKKRKVIGSLVGIMAASLYVALGRSSVGLNKLGLYASKAARVIANAKLTASALSFVKSTRPLIITGMRIVAGMTSVLSGIAMLLVLFSSGGIERDGVSRSQQTPPSP